MWIFDPGGGPSTMEYCAAFGIVDTRLLEFSTSVSSRPPPCEKDCELLFRRASWHWTEALDPENRDSLVAVNPGFIRQLYYQWSLEFMNYGVPVAVDLLSRYDVSCTPFNPLQLSTKQNPGTYYPHKLQHRWNLL